MKGSTYLYGQKKPKTCQHKLLGIILILIKKYFKRIQASALPKSLLISNSFPLCNTVSLLKVWRWMNFKWLQSDVIQTLQNGRFDVFEWNTSKRSFWRVSLTKTSKRSFWRFDVNSSIRSSGRFDGLIQGSIDGSIRSFWRFDAR